MVMSPRPAPNLDDRRDLITRTTRTVAEAEGWGAVTMRRLAGELGVTQPVLYSAFASRQALIDAVALDGFDELASALDAVDAAPLPRMRAYLDFAVAHPRVYEAMFSLPSELVFAVEGNAQSLQRAFAGLRAAFPPVAGSTTGSSTEPTAVESTAADTWTEVTWSLLHGLATLRASGRLAPGQEEARLDLAHRMATQHPTQQPTQPLTQKDRA
jgi:AcrR family transcriptional regulator